MVNKLKLVNIRQQQKRFALWNAGRTKKIIFAFDGSRSTGGLKTIPVRQKPDCQPSVCSMIIKIRLKNSGDYSKKNGFLIYGLS